MYSRVMGAAAAAVVFAAVGAPAVSATLIGDTIAVEYRLEGNSSFPLVDSVTVGGGIELSCDGGSPLCGALFPAFSVDFGADAIVFAQDTDGAAGTYSFSTNGWTFSGVGFGAGIGSVTLTSFGLGGFDQSDVSFTADSIALNLTGVTFEPVNGWTLTLTERTAVIPLPAGLPLAATALAALGLIARRRRA